MRSINSFSRLRKYSLLFVIFCIILALRVSNAQDKPERAILVLIDGLHFEANQKVDMPAIDNLIKQGAYIEKTTSIMPYHPRHGNYAKVHSASFPNPVLMAGTVFLREGQDMIQDEFENTAFIANTRSYQSITPGYDFVIQKTSGDDFSIDQALNILKNNEIDFMRVHLQRAGSGGHESVRAPEGSSYRYNIWDEASPYVEGLKEADRQLDRFINELKAMGKWESTLFILSSDHGQTRTGWHPVIPEESWLVPTIFTGPGIKKGVNYPWADHIDIIPTITNLMDVPAPNSGGGSGRVLSFIKEGEVNPPESFSSRVFDLNSIMARYLLVTARLMSKSEDYPYLNAEVMQSENEFYGLDRIMEWNELGSIEKLNEHNLEIVEHLEELLAKSPE